MTLIPAIEKRCVVLMSGGIDSSATVVACQESGATLSGMFVGYIWSLWDDNWEAIAELHSNFCQLDTANWRAE